ncbi:hypothetical protein I4U23_020709 [Adineta vaga]|nr:hypothetical protein I4U23_020709 [Adineta vaga]
MKKKINKSSKSRSFIYKIGRIYVTKYDLCLFIVIVILICASLKIWMLNDKSSDNVYQSERILVVKRGMLHGNTYGGNHLKSDAEIADLDFSHRITDVETFTIKDEDGRDTLGCIKFLYSHGRYGQEYGCENHVRLPENSKKMSLDKNETITRVTTYEQNRTIRLKVGSSVIQIIAGIEFETNYGHSESFGITEGIIRTEKIANYFVGFVYGKYGGNIDCLRFVWYRDCLKNSLIDN